MNRCTHVHSKNAIYVMDNYGGVFYCMLAVVNFYGLREKSSRLLENDTTFIFEQMYVLM